MYINEFFLRMYNGKHRQITICKDVPTFQKLCDMINKLLQKYSFRPRFYFRFYRNKHDLRNN